MQTFERLLDVMTADVPHTSAAYRQRWFLRLWHNTYRPGQMRVLEMARRLRLVSADLIWLIPLLAIERDLSFHRLRARWFSADE